MYTSRLGSVVCFAGEELFRYEDEEEQTISSQNMAFNIISLKQIGFSLASIQLEQ